MIFSLEEVDPCYHETSISFFVILTQLNWGREGTTAERWIFEKIEYLMVNSWKESFINKFWAHRRETPEGNRRNGKFQIWYAKSWVPLRCTRKPSKGKHWMCDMVVGRESSDIVCFSLKTWFLVSI
jgi:hypothetical protein